MDPQLLVLLSVGTLLILNGILGHAGVLGTDDTDQPRIAEASAAPEADLPPAA